MGAQCKLTALGRGITCKFLGKWGGGRATEKLTLRFKYQRYSKCSTLRSEPILEPEDNNATSDSELQSSDSEDPDDSEDDAQSDSSEMGNFIEHSYEVLFVPDTDVQCVTVQSK